VSPAQQCDISSFWAEAASEPTSHGRASRVELHQLDTVSPVSNRGSRAKPNPRHRQDTTLPTYFTRPCVPNYGYRNEGASVSPNLHAYTYHPERTTAHAPLGNSDEITNDRSSASRDPRHTYRYNSGHR
jgi:hypothetical protein